MNVDLGILSKLTRVVLFLLVIAGILVIAIWYFPRIKQNERMRKEIVRLDAQIAKSEENGRQLKTSLDALKYDSKAVERLAREKFSYASPGENNYRFVLAPPNLPSRR